jgi:hypothetical protein
MSREEVFDRMFPNDNDKEQRARIWLSFVHQNYLTSFKRFLLCQENALLNNYLVYTDRYLATSEEITSTYVGFKEMFGQ